MKLVYIAGPFTAKNGFELAQNINRAEEYAMVVAKMGAVPVCPHTMYRNFAWTITDSFWYRATMDLLKVCHALLMVHRWRNSAGSLNEVNYCTTAGIPAFYAPDLDQLEKWLAK